MKIMFIAINTASSQTAIALLSDKILAEDSWDSENNEAEKLMPAIDKLFKKAGKKYSDMEKIVVINGPGSFTGLRVGVTVANTIAYLGSTELYALDTFSYWWNLTENSDKYEALLIYAGSKGVYLSFPNDSPDFTKKAQNINIEDLHDYLLQKNIKTVFGDITKDQKKTLKNIEFAEQQETFAQKMEKIEFHTLKAHKIIEPIYIKSPGITLSKKKLND